MPASSTASPRGNSNARPRGGAQLLAAKRTRFRLWAPSRDAVQLELVEGATLEMAPVGDGWFQLEVECGAGTRYRYRLAPELAVPDPASRFQPDDVHGPSEVVDPAAYQWTHENWRGRPWQQVVLYELHVGAFGGYRGVTERLPELAELGVSAIELMPLNDFPGARNWGYDGVLPYAPDSAYGTPDELKALIDTAHGLNLMVFLDVVYNHFGPDGNYLPAYAAPFFKAEAATPWGPAIDFEQPEVRQFFFDNATYWLNEYRFDGLRLDAVHAIGDDEWLRQLADHVHRSVEPGRHVHLVLENEHNTASLLEHHFDAQWNDDAHNALHVLLTGETESYYEAYAEHPMRKLARALSSGFVYQGEPSPSHAGRPRGEPSAHLPPSAFVMFLQNHDQVGNRAFGERLRALAEPEALRAATALLLLSPQIPLLFMGEEWGSTQPFLFFTSYTGDLAQAVREGRRREFAKLPGFNDVQHRARIPDPNDARTFNASVPRRRESGASDQRDWLNFYRSALKVRRDLLIPRLAASQALGATVLQSADGAERRALMARWRLGDGAMLSLALNLERDAVPLPCVPDGAIIFRTPSHVLGQHDVAAAPSGELPPHSCIVWLAHATADAKPCARQPS